MLSTAQMQELLNSAAGASKNTQTSFFYADNWNHAAEKLQIQIERSAKAVKELLIADPTLNSQRPPNRAALHGRPTDQQVLATGREDTKELQILVATQKQQAELVNANITIFNGIITTLLEMQRKWMLDRRCYDVLDKYRELIVLQFLNAIAERESLLAQCGRKSEEYSALSGGQINALYDLIYAAVYNTSTYLKIFRNKNLMSEINVMAGRLSTIQTGVKQNIESHITAQISAFHTDVATVTVEGEKKIRADKVDFEKLRELFGEFNSLVQRVLMLQRDHLLNVYFSEFVKTFFDYVTSTFQIVLQNNRDLKQSIASNEASKPTSAKNELFSEASTDEQKDAEVNKSQIRTIANIARSNAPEAERLQKILKLTEGYTQSTLKNSASEAVSISPVVSRLQPR